MKVFEIYDFRETHMLDWLNGHDSVRINKMEI